MPNSRSRATNGTPNLLFINQGDGTFREEARTWGTADARWSYAGAFADVDGDRRQDLYVANDLGENALFMDRVDHFEDEASTDDAVLKKLAAGNSLFENNGDGTFQNVAESAGGFGAVRAYGGGFVDSDNDKREDTYLVNGFVFGKTMKDT